MTDDELEAMALLALRGVFLGQSRSHDVVLQAKYGISLVALKQYLREAYNKGVTDAANIAATMAERPYDNEPEFSAVLAVEAAIRRSAP